MVQAPSNPSDRRPAGEGASNLEEPPALPARADSRTPTRTGKSTPPRLATATPAVPNETAIALAERIPIAAALEVVARAETEGLDEQGHDERNGTELASVLRRDESVIASAVHAQRNPVHRIQVFARATARQLVEQAEDMRDAYEEWRTKPLPSNPRRLQAALHRAANRVSQLPKSARIALLTVPYAAALALALAITLSGGRPPPAQAIASIEASAPAQPAPAAPVEREEVAPAGASASTPAPPALEAPVAQAQTPTTDIAQPPPVAAGESLVSKAPIGNASNGESTLEVLHTLPVRGTLRATPSIHGAKVARMAAGSRLLLYPSVPAPEGWMVARKPRGEIGFIESERLNARAEAEATPPPARQRRKKSRMLDIPWP